MPGIIFALVIAAALICLYVLLIRPGTVDREKFRPFESVMIAHRGLYDNDTDAPENSLPAFRKAVDAGFGIELDVQLTTDGKLVVFHDETLRRMCGADKVLTELSYDELMNYTLLDSGEHVPLFEDVFDIFRGRVPAMIEIKPHGNYRMTCEKLMGYLDGYDGAYLVQSFHPNVVAWFRKNRPDVVRGQLSTVFAPNGKAPWIARFAVTNLLTDIYARPQFISYDIRHMNQFSFRMARRLYGPENAVWTVQSREDLDKAKGTFSIFIFDSFDPGTK